MTDPRFIAWAQRFPLTRPIARSKSLDLFNIVAGFSYSQVLFACVKLGLFEKVGRMGIARSELGASLPLPAEKSELLFRAAIALKLLDEDGCNIILGSRGASLYAQPWIEQFIEHHTHFYRDLEDPIALLQGQSAPNGLKDYWAYDQPDKDRAAYSHLIAQSQKAVSEQILAAHDFSTYRNVLDVAGGTGAFLTALGARYPTLQLNLVDLPNVIKLVTNPRIQTFALDARLDPLPEKIDLITVIRVLHDHNDDAVRALLKNIRRSATPGTTLLIAEPFAGNATRAPVTDAYFNLYFAAMGQGRTRTPAEMTALAGEAGFGRPRLISTQIPMITGLMLFSTASHTGQKHD